MTKILVWKETCIQYTKSVMNYIKFSVRMHYTISPIQDICTLAQDRHHSCDRFHHEIATII